MKVELPELKRCCFCIPLRYGLIAWGYIKLALLLLLFSTAMFSVVYSIQMSMRRMSHMYVEEIVIISLTLLVILIDISFTILFLVGGHRKSAKLLHIYYIYNIVLLCLYTLLFTAHSAFDLYYMSRYIDYMPHGYLSYIPVIQIKLLFGIFVLGAEVYIILLTRSEVNKLRNSSKYRFSNLTAEAEHTPGNGRNEQGINYSKEVSFENKNDSQFEGIINKTEKSGRENFSYNKL